MGGCGSVEGGGMRKIRFRAWEVKQKSMVGFLPLCRIIANFHGLNDEEWANLIWMQYTGLLDSEGVEIYEGDVVDWLGDKFKIIIYCATAWVQSETKQLPLYEIDNTEIKVIGNTHEHPHLIGE